MLSFIKSLLFFALKSFNPLLYGVKPFLNVMKKFSFLVFLSLAFILSCDKAEEIPAYIRLEPFVVQTIDGTSFQEITEGWIFVDGEFLGAYSLPGEVPVLKTGTLDVEVAPGIKENGIANTPNIYTPLVSYKTIVDLVAGETLTVYPKTSYNTNTSVPNGGQEDFEGGSTIPFEDADNYPTSFLKIENGGKFNRHLVLQIDTLLPENSINTTPAFEGIPVSGGQEVWLEMHYQNSVPFSVYLFGSDKNDPEFIVPIQVFSFNNAEEWNKIYLNLTEFVSSNPYERYALAFRAILPKDFDGNYTQNEGTVRLDNIKIVHF